MNLPNSVIDKPFLNKIHIDHLSKGFIFQNEWVNEYMDFLLRSIQILKLGHGVIPNTTPLKVVCAVTLN